MLLSPARREEVLGDLQEQYLAAPPSRALRRYLREVAALLPAAIANGFSGFWSSGCAVSSLNPSAGVTAVRSQVEQFQQANHCRLVFYSSFAFGFSVLCVWRVLLADAWLPRIFLTAFILLLVFTAQQHYVRGSGRSVPAGASLGALLDFHSRELARRRDFLRTLWYWKMAPLALPIFAALALRRSDTALTTTLWVTACYALSYRTARREAGRIEQRLAELDDQRASLAGAD